MSEKSFFKIVKADNRSDYYIYGKRIFTIKHKSLYSQIYEKRFRDDLSLNDKKYFLQAQFEHNVGYPLNIDNPKTFNEKLQWLKLFYQNPLMTVCADKIAVRNYIKEQLGDEYLVPVLGIYNHPDEIDFSSLPDRFVLKVNWGSGQNIIVKDKSSLDIEKTKKQLAEWLKPTSNHYYHSFEWCYKDIKPGILCEKYIENADGLNDYKFLCYNGIVKNMFIVQDRDKGKENMSVTFFDRNFQKLPVQRLYKSSDKEIVRPEKWDKMIEISEKLAKNFPFIRVDFYEIENTLKIGELTFFPGNGMEKFTPQEWDLKFGEMLKLPK